MASSQKWLMLAAILAVLFVGTANAWQNGNQCPSGYKSCYPGHGYRKCETCIENDVNNCGDCHKKCQTLPYTNVKCVYGKCKYTCTPGWADCDHNLWKNGCEKDVRNDVYNCGSCGHKCPCSLRYGEAYCSNGKCYERCKSGWKYDSYKKCCVPYHH